MTTFSKNGPGGARYVALETYRRDGQTVRTPVWVVALDGRLYVTTTSSSGKAKRLRRDPRCGFAACDLRGRKTLGPWCDGTVRPVSDPLRSAEVERLFRRKYTWQYFLFEWAAYRPSRRCRGVEWVLLEIEFRPRA